LADNDNYLPCKALVPNLVGGVRVCGLSLVETARLAGVSAS
jgi:hypothetical protein